MDTDILTHYANSAAEVQNIPLDMKKPKVVQNAEHIITYDMGDMMQICHQCSAKYFIVLTQA